MFFIICLAIIFFWYLVYKVVMYIFIGQYNHKKKEKELDDRMNKYFEEVLSKGKKDL